MTRIFRHMSPLWLVETPKSSSTGYTLQFPFISQSLTMFFWVSFYPVYAQLTIWPKTKTEPYAGVWGSFSMLLPAFCYPTLSILATSAALTPSLFPLLGETRALNLDSSSLWYILKNAPRQIAGVNAKLALHDFLFSRIKPLYCLLYSLVFVLCLDSQLFIVEELFQYPIICHSQDQMYCPWILQWKCFWRADYFQHVRVANVCPSPYYMATFSFNPITYNPLRTLGSFIVLKSYGT